MAVKMIKPPFMGASDILEFSVKDVFQHLDKQVLFKSRWKMLKGGEEMLTDLLEDERILAYMKPQALYGYFPVYRKESSLVLENTVWNFPKVKSTCLVDYFYTKDEGGDFIALQAVTIGSTSVELSKTMYANNDYAEYFLLYGLAAEMTETLAEMVNDKINKELGLKKTLRRSFGYPACPELSYQRALLELLKSDKIGLTLNESNQLVPEFSTTAFIVTSQIGR